VLLRDLGLDVPVQAVALAGHDVDGLVGHVPVFRALAGCRDLLLVDVDTVGAHLRLLGRRDDAHAAVARVLPAGVALFDDLLLLRRAGSPELGPILARADTLCFERPASTLLPAAHRPPFRLPLHDAGDRAHPLARPAVLAPAGALDDRPVVLPPLATHAAPDPLV